jgi:hypothetical protein
MYLRACLDLLQFLKNIFLEIVSKKTASHLMKGGGDKEGKTPFGSIEFLRNQFLKTDEPLNRIFFL